LQAKESGSQSASPWSGSINVKLNNTIIELKQEISNESSIPAKEIQKILCAGK
jgi:hypothetical protein